MYGPVTTTYFPKAIDNISKEEVLSSRNASELTNTLACEWPQTVITNRTKWTQSTRSSDSATRNAQMFCLRPNRGGKRILCVTTRPHKDWKWTLISWFLYPTSPSTWAKKVDKISCINCSFWCSRTDSGCKLRKAEGREGICAQKTRVYWFATWPAHSNSAIKCDSPMLPTKLKNLGFFHRFWVCCAAGWISWGSALQN